MGEFYDDRNDEPDDEPIRKTYVHYDKFNKSWFIPKGEDGIAWQDGPLKDRKTHNIKTSKDIIAFNSNTGFGFEAFVSTDTHLVIINRSSGDKPWFLQVNKHTWQ